MTEDNEHGTSVLPFYLLASVGDKKGFVIERSFFDHSHIADNSPEYLTQDELLSLVEPYTTVPFKGERGIQVMREQWQGTPFEQALQELPEGETVSAKVLQEVIGKQLEASEADVDVAFRWVTRLIDGEWVTDKKYHLDWQGRAIAYRLAAEQAVGGELVERDRDEINILFTPRITRSNAFILCEESEDAISNAPWYTEDLLLHRNQYRLIEQTEDGRFVERAVLPFLNISKREDTLEAEREDILTVLLDAAYPAELFDENREFAGGVPWIDHAIIAPMPNDLAIPDDMRYCGWDIPNED